MVFPCIPHPADVLATALIGGAVTLGVVAMIPGVLAFAVLNRCVEARS